jgi:hypothetical protein
MNSTAFSNTCASFLLLALAGCSTAPRLSGVLSDLRLWSVEKEQAATVVSVRNGVIDIDTPAGVTVWLREEIVGPAVIEFDAIAVAAGGPNDQVSDLNVFWMARNRDGSSPLSTPRSGRFGGYDDLTTYYVGLGGNRNTTSRFRRYVGETGNRPLLPEHDLAVPEALLVPNQSQRITLVANGGHIEYRRDGRPLFVYEDAAPYTRGWFGFRTTSSHLRIENLRIRRLTRIN